MPIQLPLFIVALLLPLSAWSQAGEVRFALGDAKVQRASGTQERLERGTRLAEGDTVITGASGHVQITMVDNAVVAVRPNTQLKLEEYRYSGKADGSERGIFGLIRGGFRSITGLIGQQNRNAYSVRTPTATIGIRGTDHESMHIPPPAPGETPVGDPGTYDKVNSGSTILQTSSGSIVIQPNQVGFAPAQPGSPPVTLPKIPDFMRSTPPAQPNSQGQGGSSSGAPLPPPPPPPSGTSSGPSDTISTVSTLPPPPLPPAPQPGTIDPAQIPAGAIALPVGNVLVGGDLSAGLVGNGAGITGDSQSNFAALVDGSGHLIAVSSSTFNYNRDGATVVHQESTMVGSETVNWGVYAGGTISDQNGLRYPQFFHYMLGGQASSSFSLFEKMPNADDTMYFSGAAGFTKPIAENGAVGGNIVEFSIGLKNGGGMILVSEYYIMLDDALGRTWEAYTLNPQGLATFTHNPGQNLSVNCSSCPAGTSSGQASGMAIGNPVSGFVSSYSLKQGAAGVTGSVVALESIAQ